MIEQMIKILVTAIVTTTGAEFTKIFLNKIKNHSFWQKSDSTCDQDNDQS